MISWLVSYLINCYDGIGYYGNVVSRKEYVVIKCLKCYKAKFYEEDEDYINKLSIDSKPYIEYTPDQFIDQLRFHDINLNVMNTYNCDNCKSL